MLIAILYRVFVNLFLVFLVVQQAQGFAKSGAEVLLLNISARFNSSNSIELLY